MHRSRLQTVVVDCDDIEKGKAFWTGALGTGVAGEDNTYVLLEPVLPELRFLLQYVPERKTCKSRVHLDIESDEVDAEVRRLEKLGARPVKQVESWWWMEDPCGNEFCIVPARDTPEFKAHAREWGEP